jgi:antitoxin component HigA of HigAB toxin-antitoxin module
MKRKHLQSWVALSALGGFLCVSTPARAQSAPAQDNPLAQENASYRQSLAEFNQFLDSHPETAEQLRKEPDLVLNDEYLSSHPELQQYLQQHPGVRDQMRKDPNQFMSQEEDLEHRGGNDANRDRRDLAEFNRFLDTHRETAEQLRKQPDLVENQEFLTSHPELRDYLQQHPGVRDQILKNPNAFMAQEDRLDNRDNNSGDRDRRDVVEFNHFLDTHRETAEQLRKQPDLVENQEFLKSHPALQDYLQQHPGVRDQIVQNPNAFMAQEDRLDDRGNNGREANREELANFDRFLDTHRETAEQLRKEPDLVENQEFLKSHPALQGYLQQHPGVRDEIRQNPNAFMQEEARNYQPRPDEDRDSSVHRQFGQFLGSHSDIARQLAENPALCKDHDYLENHPELRDYLNSHPDVQQRLTADPQNFMKSAQQFNTTTTPGTTPGQTTKSPAPMTDPTKPKL